MQNNYQYYLYFIGNDGKIIPIMIDKDWKWERIRLKLESKMILEKLRELTPRLN